jgi:quinol monooxygenase YgiN
VDDGIARVRDQVWPELRQSPGCIGLSMLADRDSGRCIITTAWTGEQATHTGSDRVSALPDQTGDVLGGVPEIACWEIARVHRFRPSGDGACAQVTWGATRPEQLDRDLDVFTYSMVPELEDVPGFCSVSQLVDRATGRSATAISYLSRTAMTRAHRQTEAMRQEFAHMTGIGVLEVADFDLVVAHLRVPEMA